MPAHGRPRPPEPDPAAPGVDLRALVAAHERRWRTARSSTFSLAPGLARPSAASALGARREHAARPGTGAREPSITRGFEIEATREVRDRLGEPTDHTFRGALLHIWEIPDGEEGILLRASPAKMWSGSDVRARIGGGSCGEFLGVGLGEQVVEVFARRRAFVLRASRAALREGTRRVHRRLSLAVEGRRRGGGQLRRSRLFMCEGTWLNASATGPGTGGQTRIPSLCVGRGH